MYIKCQSYFSTRYEIIEIKFLLFFVCSFFLSFFLLCVYLLVIKAGELGVSSSLGY